MKETLRMMAAGAAGGVLVVGAMLAQPALADVQAKTAAKNSVVSKSIKNGSVKGKDLAADVNASLAKANSALQSVPDNSVTTAKIADNAVTSAKVADNSLAAADLAPNSVGTSEVTNGSLTSADVAVNHGTVDQNLASIAAGACASFTQASGGVLAGDLVLANADLSLDDGLTVSGRSGPGVGNLSNIQIIVCNTTGAAINPPNTTFSWAVIEN
jgi:hypothetical protein